MRLDLEVSRVGGKQVGRSEASSLLVLIMAEATLEAAFQFGGRLPGGGRGGRVLEPAGVATALVLAGAS